MGILNITPDSFSDGGLSSQGLSAAVDAAKQLADSGADIIDIGGQSTRPGADFVGAEEECSRVVPLIRSLFICSLDGFWRMRIGYGGPLQKPVLVLHLTAFDANPMPWIGLKYIQSSSNIWLTLSMKAPFALQNHSCCPPCQSAWVHCLGLKRKNERKAVAWQCPCVCLFD